MQKIHNSDEKTRYQSILCEDDFYINKFFKSHGLNAEDENGRKYLDQIQKDQQKIKIRVSNLINLSKISFEENQKSIKTEPEKTENENSQNSPKVFTLSSAYDQIGGFGLFQFVALICLTLIRNFGSPNVYMFGFTIATMKYECRNSISENFQICSPEKICSARADPLMQDFEFRPDESMPDFFNNWYVLLDLICYQPQSELPQICAIYFFGYGFGIILFFMPDKYGRKRAMQIILPLFILTQYLVLFRPEIYLKKIGFFFQGFFHLRLTNAVTHILEMVSTKHRNIVSTVIAAWDSGSTGLICFIIVVFHNNEDNILKLYCILATAGTMVYFLAIPESPRWLFESNRDHEAILALNYIAWFNRSQNRVPLDAHFDPIGQAVEENLQLNSINTGQYKCLINVNPKPQEPEESMTSVIKRMFCSKEHAKNHISLGLMFACAFLIYFVALYNSTKLNGNILYIGMLFGFAEILGIGFSERVVTLFDPIKGQIVTSVIIMILSLVQKVFALHELLLYATFTVMVFCIGLLFQTTLLLQHIYMIKPEIVNMSYEFNYTFGQFLTLFAPILAMLDEPYPTLSIWVFAMVTIKCALSLEVYENEERIENPDDKFLTSLITYRNTEFLFDPDQIQTEIDQESKIQQESSTFNILQIEPNN